MGETDPQGVGALRTQAAARKLKLTDSQEKVLRFLRENRGWFRPGSIHPADYSGGAAVIGRVLSSLVNMGLVTFRKGDRGNGTACVEYSAVKGRR